MLVVCDAPVDAADDVSPAGSGLSLPQEARHGNHQSRAKEHGYFFITITSVMDM